MQFIDLISFHIKATSNSPEEKKREGEKKQKIIIYFYLSQDFNLLSISLDNSDLFLK